MEPKKKKQQKNMHSYSLNHFESKANLKLNVKSRSRSKRATLDLYRIGKNCRTISPCFTFKYTEAYNFTSFHFSNFFPYIFPHVAEPMDPSLNALMHSNVLRKISEYFLKTKL